jgi:AraC family transcriptional regulator
MTTASMALHGREIARGLVGDWQLSVTRYDRESAIPIHLHEAPYATVVVRGGYEEISGRESRQCVAGSIVVHTSGERHADRFAGPTTCLNIHGGLFGTSGVIPPVAANGIASKLRREFLQPDDCSAQIIDALMMELDALSRRDLGEDRVPPWLRNTRRWIESHFRESLTVSELALHAGVHATHLARSFRQHYGMTVGEMLRERRIEHARRELQSGRALSEIASEAGFADQSHFTRVFRRATGTTPAAYRRAR